ncbi:hypothetical protein B0H11DRAFT_1870950 [Mycena galericulata]|nr:hypothetical protein B0H11DRAFT_1870950 [Mycena galericulata]
MSINPNNICLQCKKREKRVEYQFCSRQCTKDAAARAPELLKIPETHVMYRNVYETFCSKWTENVPPTISSIYLITWTANLRSSFDGYRDMVQSRTGKKECKRFRSEKRACKLGEPGSLALCQRPDCHLCKAIRTGFQSSLEYKRSIRGLDGLRLGRGIYTTPSSSKAYQYAVNIGSADGSNMKAVLSTRIVLGDPSKTKHEDPSLCEPPSGYQSVKGVPGKNSEFLDQEDVVYHEDAIRPAYLIMLKD